MKIKYFMYTFLIALFACGVTACSSGQGKGSNAAVQVKFSGKKTGKTVSSVPANVHKVKISATPMNATIAPPSPLTIVFSNTTTAQTSTPFSVADNVTYKFDVWGHDITDTPTYFGTVSQQMLPGNNTINIVCTPYTPPVIPVATWEAKAPMTTARSRAASATVNGRIYVIGGQDASGAVVNTLEIYDPVANTWAPGPTMPTARRYAAAVAIGTKIFVIGGEDATIPTSQPLASMDVLDTTTGTWVPSPPATMQAPRARLSCVAYNGIIYAIGGTDSSGATSLTTVEQFDTTAITGNNWISAPSLSTARARFSAFITQDLAGNTIIEAVGGGTPSSSISSRESLILAPIAATNWVPSSSALPAARASYAAAVAGNFAYIIGGHDAANVLTSTVWTYDFTSAAYTTLAAPLPTPRDYPVVQTVNGRVYVIGGDLAPSSAPNRIASNAVEELTPVGSMPRLGKVSTLTGLASVTSAELSGITLLLDGQSAVNGPLFAQLININTDTAATPIALNITPASPADPDAPIAIGGGKALIVAQEATGLFVSTIDALNPTVVLNKVQLDAAFPVAPSPSIAIAFDGTTFLVVWNGPTNTLYGRFVDTSGNPTAPAFSIGTGEVLGVRYGGGVYLVLTGEFISTNVAVRATAIIPGAVSTAATTTISSGPGNNYWGSSVDAFNGSEFGVSVIIGNGTADILSAVAVRYSGANLTFRQPIVVAPAPGLKTDSHVAWDGFKWLINWFEVDASSNKTGYYRFIDTNGSLLGAKTIYTSNISNSQSGGKIWWSSSLNAYLLIYGSPTSGFFMSTLQP